MHRNTASTFPSFSESQGHAHVRKKVEKHFIHLKKKMEPGAVQNAFSVLDKGKTEKRHPLNLNRFVQIYLHVGKRIHTKIQRRKILCWELAGNRECANLERWCHHRPPLAVGQGACVWTQHRLCPRLGAFSCGYWSLERLPWCLRMVLHRSLQ